MQGDNCRVMRGKKQAQECITTMAKAVQLYHCSKNC
jgi:hypothetical protein